MLTAGDDEGEAEAEEAEGDFLCRAESAWARRWTAACRAGRMTLVSAVMGCWSGVDDVGVVGGSGKDADGEVVEDIEGVGLVGVEAALGVVVVVEIGRRE